ncbi:MAG TPA: NADP-dependent oxidoreductase [Hellea balneolensis]|uniref:NADP-dependent oxidoreductase n=1 Tax=Hellea balneolensis TaxID=287478 RepID=A0A7C5M0R2_9PROT|nr:NADP-dependent oxidoreductase [Hellea balneolensis]
MNLTSKNVCLKSHPVGEPKASDFFITETEVPAPKNGEITIKNHFMSVDPYMRSRMSGIKTYIDPFELGEPMEGGAVGEIIESGHPEYKKGDWVVHMKGWREALTAPVDELRKVQLQKIDPGLIPPQSFLSVAGMTGLTAYAGLYKVAEFKPGETVLVSGAAGAVGSVVCQLAKADGAKVIAIAGGKDNCDWLREIGVDTAIDYKAEADLSKAIYKAVPEGVDIYFENVGGKVLEAALNNMKQFGRIPACGMISQYNNEKPEPGPSNLVLIVGKSLRIQGFIVSDYTKYALEYLSRLGPLMAEGKLVQAETVLEGIENAPEAFLRLVSGKKRGKMLVKLG